MNLTGEILIAMPGMGDLRFEHSVVFMCSHGAEGAMGLIVNKPTHDVRLSDLLEQLKISPQLPEKDMTVHFGGPMENARGFVLHSPDYQSKIHSLNICEHFSLTATLDILEDIASGEGPNQFLMALGYAGWAPGQLEQEIARNGWITSSADPDLIYAPSDTDKWGAALKSMGVDPLTLSASAGHA